MEKYKIFWKYTFEPVLKTFTGKSKEVVTTECFIERRVNNTVSVVSSGKSVCKKDDNFSKRLGRKKSFERAVSLLKHDRDLRTQLWNQFAEISPKSLKKLK